MSTDVMANFMLLDELVQVIYQGMNKFVVLSDVADDKWNGRWWRGSWRAADVLAIVGKTASDKLLESFAEKLAESIVQGELFVEEGERYKLTLGPTSKKPMHVALKEMSPTEAAAYATDVLVTVSIQKVKKGPSVTNYSPPKIALNAQSRQSRLNGFAAPLASTSTSVASRAPPPAASSSNSKPTASKARPPADHGADKKSVAKPATGSADTEAQEEIKALKAELVKQQQKKRHASPEHSAPKATTAAPRALKGASLANPNKKARKYQAIEFESDEE
ncbi:hypothetical protein C8R46DRAFT_1055077 [Mycena filopes]|nr:hypothetical protein C8R46DRAFT_1055077 [Mycena filopes]